MKRKISEKLGRRGKIGLAVLIAFMFIGAASAGLLDYYGRLEVTVDVSQAVVLDDGTDPIIDSLSVIGGDTECSGPHTLTNNANQDATVRFVTTIDPSEEPTGVTVRYMNYLLLENKDPSDWTMIDDDVSADLMYTIVNNEDIGVFEYKLEATGLESNENYVLIYYADFDPRFETWGGNNPGALIGTFLSDDDGNINVDDGAVNLYKEPMDLPYEPDWNINPDPDYCDYHNGYDDYEHGTSGAKIWLVPAEYYEPDGEGSGVVTTWAPDTFLFETDLIRYFDNDNSEIVIPAGESIDFYVCYDFALDIESGNYIITTFVEPVVE